MHRPEFLRLSTALALAMAFAAPAWACPPPEPPPLPLAPEAGESPDAFMARYNAHQAKLAEAERRKTEAYERAMLDHESTLWTKSETVLVARVVGRSQRRVDFYAYKEVPLVRLRPVRTLKGRRASRSFAVTYTGDTDCGPYGGGDAVTGAVGELFVVFVAKGAPGRASVSDSIGTARARDPRTKAALAADPGHH